MKAIRYLIEVSPGHKIPELSIYVENYSGKYYYIFLSREMGANLTSVEEGKSRIASPLIDRSTARQFEINADMFIVFDLVDTLLNQQNDVKTLIDKHLPVFKNPAPAKEVAE